MSFRFPFFRFPTLIVAGLALAAAPLPAQQASRHTLSGNAVALYNIAGTVRVDPGSGAAVTAEVTRHGADAARLEVRTDAIRGRETLRVIYPEDRIVYAPLGSRSRTEMQVADDGTFSGGWERGTRSRRVRIEGEGSGLDAYADLRVLVPAGKSVAIHLGVGAVTVTNVDGALLVDVGAADVTASGTRGSLALDLGSGDATVRGSQGDLSVDGGSGDILLERVTGDAISLDLGSGSVTARELRASKVSVDAGSGNVTLDDVSAHEIELDTGSGDVALTLATDVERLTLDSGSGDVVIRAPADFGVRVEAETGSGSILGTLAQGLTRDEDGDRVTGVIGDGDGTLTIDTGSGDVTLERR
jgi:molybdopterin-binding protein